MLLILNFVKFAFHQHFTTLSMKTEKMNVSFNEMMDFKVDQPDRSNILSVFQANLLWKPVCEVFSYPGNVILFVMC